MNEDLKFLEKLEQKANQQLVQLAQSGLWRQYHGREQEQLVQLLQECFGQSHVRCCASGTATVELALRGLQVQPGDRVLLAGYDFPGNFRAIEALGARPVLADLEDDQWVMAAPPPSDDFIKALIVSPLYGSIPDMPQLLNWCREAGTSLILDMCQCPGATLEPTDAPHSKVGSHSLAHWADVTCLSFGGSKVLSSGRGGAILSDDAAVMARIARYVERGNDLSPISLMQATVLLPQLQELESANQSRRRLIESFNDVSDAIPYLSDPLTEPQQIRRQVQRVYYKKAWMVAEGVEREEILAAAEKVQLPLGAGFQGFTRRTNRRCDRLGELPNSQVASERTIVLHHNWMTTGNPQEKKHKLIEFFSCF